MSSHLPQIIGSITSPYVRKVRMVALEKKLDCEFVTEDVWSAGSTIAEKNPLGKVPVLVLEDGCLYDSRVIVEYLDNRAPTHKLIPEGNRDRTHVRLIESLADGLCDAGIAILVEHKFHQGEAVSQAYVERQMNKIHHGLKALSEALGGEAHFYDRGFTLADIAVAAALGYLDLRYASIDWRGFYPNLASFQARMSERASFQATQPS